MSTSECHQYPSVSVDARAGWSRDAPKELNDLITALYSELRRLAAREMKSADGAITLGPTALVHEAYLRLSQAGIVVESRAHFLHLAAQVMRCILVDRARARMADKRGRNIAVLPLDSLQIGAPIPDRDLLALNDALSVLDKMDPQKSRLVELRFFAGMSVEEAAEVLGISPRTAAREWLVAKARLYAEIGRTSSPGRAEPKDRVTYGRHSQAGS